MKISNLRVYGRKLGVLFPVQEERVLECGFVIPAGAEYVSELLGARERLVKCEVLASGVDGVRVGDTAVMRMEFGHTAFTSDELDDVPDGYEFRIYDGEDLEGALVGVMG
jgi:hypothetical protein